MKPLQDNEVKGTAKRFGYTAQNMADYLGLKIDTYNYQAREPQKRFSDESKAKLTELFGWSFDQMNKALYGGKLPFNDGGAMQDG